MISRFVLIYVWVIISSLHLTAGNDLTDSLLGSLQNNSNEEKAATYIQISEAYRFTDLSKCIVYGDSAVALAQKGGADQVPNILHD